MKMPQAMRELLRNQLGRKLADLGYGDKGSSLGPDAWREDTFPVAGAHVTQPEAQRIVPKGREVTGGNGPLTGNPWADDDPFNFSMLDVEIPPRGADPKPTYRLGEVDPRSGKRQMLSWSTQPGAGWVDDTPLPDERTWGAIGDKVSGVLENPRSIIPSRYSGDQERFDARNAALAPDVAPHMEGDPVDREYEERKAKAERDGMIQSMHDLTKPSPNYSTKDPDRIEKNREMAEEERDAEDRERRAAIIGRVNAPAHEAHRRATSNSDQSDRDKLRMMRGVGESLSNMNLTSGSEIRLGMFDKNPPFRANEDAREGLAQLDANEARAQEIADAERMRQQLKEESAQSDLEAGTRQRGILSQHGMDFPEGTRASDIAATKGIVGDAMQAKADAAAARAPADISKMTADERKFLDSSNVAMSELVALKQLVNSGKFEVGRLDTMWNKGKAWTGAGENPDFVDYEQRIRGIINVHIKNMTGAQMSKDEAARLQAELPSPWDDTEIAAQKFDRAIKLLTQKQEEFFKNREAGGLNMSALRGNIKRRYTVDGTPYLLDGAALEDIRQKFPNSDIQAVD